MGAVITFLSSQGSRKILRWQGRCIHAAAPGQHLCRLRARGLWGAKSLFDLGPTLRRQLLKDAGAGAQVNRRKYQGKPANKTPEFSKTSEGFRSTKCQDQRKAQDCQ